MKEGDSLPNLEIENQNSEKISLSNIRHAVIYFYPKADTPGCTKEACNFRDNIKKLRKADLEIYGVSTDTVKEQKKFHEKNDLNFDLLADSEGKMSEKFNVLKESGYAERTTFLIEDGKIKKIFRKVDPEEHIKEVLDYLKK